jgi:gamma-glutamyltranspeptidase/glutathione hydrolase
MTPTLLTRDGQLTLSLGSPGGPRIISSVLQTIINVVDHGMDIQEAIDTPRIHHQWWPDTLYVERRALVNDVRDALERKGHGLGTRAVIGSVQGLQVLTSTDGQVLLLGGADPRRTGCAVGVVGERLVSRCACPACE